MQNTETQFIARQPILNNQEKVFAYEVLYRNSKENRYPPEVSETEATFNVSLDGILLHGMQKVSNGSLLFINLSTLTLLEKLPELICPDNVVIEITENTENLGEVCLTIQELKKKKYKFALDDYDGNKKWDKLIQEVDYIKLEAMSPILVTLLRIKKLKRYHPNKKIIVERIEDRESYEHLKRVGCDYFQGFLFSKPQMTQFTNVTSSKQVVLRLMKLANDKDFSFELVKSHIEKDVSLSLRLLRLINNDHIDKGSQFTSFYQAIVYLGEERLRHFIKILCISELGSDKPSGLIVQSLSRAHFISFLMEHKGSTLKDLGYFLGLISLLDVILDADMNVILEELNIPNCYREVLLQYHGGIGSLLLLCEKIEEKNWESVSFLLKLLGLELVYIKKHHKVAIDYAIQSLYME